MAPLGEPGGGGAPRAAGEANARELIYLVRDQRDDGVNNDAHARAEKSSKLKGDGLSSARWKEHHGILALEASADGVPLTFPKLLLPEQVPEEPDDIAFYRIGYRDRGC